ncbi:MAG: rRNA maturation RNase YbeY [Verrucomicrobiae bacterium]|nr:rRNA maturation RNase YbeY [Verrucomicrobiae bacterium]
MKRTGAAVRLDLAVYNRHPELKVSSTLVRRIVRAVLRDEPFLPGSCPNATHELCLVFVAAAEIEELNRRWLGHTGTTDVIAFDYRGDRAGDSLPLKGDIVVCLDEAKRQARRFRTKWQFEVVRYLLHGLLHLRGYVDSDPQERRRMRTAENKLLKKLSDRFDLCQVVARTSAGQCE